MDDANATDASRALDRRRLLAAAGAASASLTAGCLGIGGSSADDDGAATAEPTDGDWRSVELQRVRGEESFTIDDLDAPLVVESFAVWCPKCERQAGELAGADSLTRLGLNTDPNEDAERVREYAVDKGFDWRFAVAPTALTEALVAEFGTAIATAPSTPLLFVCEDGATLRSGSVLGADEIVRAAEDC